jgi:hypothetical protein
VSTERAAWPQTLPRRKHGISQSGSYYCCIFAITYGKLGIDEEESGRLPEAEGDGRGVVSFLKFAQVFHKIDRIFDLLNTIS